MNEYWLIARRSQFGWFEYLCVNDYSTDWTSDIEEAHRFTEKPLSTDSSIFHFTTAESLTESLLDSDD